MSLSKQLHEAKRWIQTAEEDLKAAEILYEAGAYAQACFHAQQCGEKAVKAIWYAEDDDPWGHSVQRLVMDFPKRNELPNFDSWLGWCALLDKFYIPTRYPNGLPDLTPGQVYRKEDAQKGLDTAKHLLDACKRWREPKQ